MTVLEEFNSLLTTSGISLASLHIADIALTLSDALRAVMILRGGPRAILGGDVYFRRGNRIEIAHDNWSSDQKPGEHRQAYLRRSWDKAESYIRGYPEKTRVEDADLLFVISLESQLSELVSSTQDRRLRSEDEPLA